MKNSKSDLYAPRDNALYEAYKDALKEDGSRSFTEAVQIAMHSPQPRMWVTFYGVYRTLLRIVHGSRSAWKHKARSGLEEAVRIRYERLKDRRAFRKASLFFIASFIVAEPTEGFFISEIIAKRIIHEKRKEYQSAWKKSLRKGTGAG